jgi:hypothetical protein
MKTDFKLPLKDGRTSTEFWLIIITGLLTTGLSALSILEVNWGAGALVVLTLAYNHSRTKLKTIQADAEAHAVKSATDVAAAKALANTETPPTQG